MKIEIRNDAVHIEGYVNAIERLSKPLPIRTGGSFVERIKKGAFARAIEKNDNIRVLLNHDWEKDLGGTKDGSLNLEEDSIGLRADMTTSNPEAIREAREGNLVGWSFGFQDVDVDTHEENGVLTRDVKDLDLFEVSLLTRAKSPAYEGTLVSVRDDQIHFIGDEMIETPEIREIKEEIPEEKPEEIREEEPNQGGSSAAIDYSKYEEMILEMKGAKRNE